MTSPAFMALIVAGIGMASGISQHMICKSVENVFAEGHSPTTGRPPMLQGRAGKKGPAGVKGDRGFPGAKGERGSPGIVDYQRVLGMVEEKLNKAANCQYDDQGFLYFGKCYFMIQTGSLNINLAEGKSMCADREGNPADVLNLKHQLLVQSYMRSKLLPRHSGVYVWLGMTYNSEENVLKFSNGETANSTYIWFAGYPKPRVGVGIESRKDASSRYQGIFTKDVDQNHHGVLCEK